MSISEKIKEYYQQHHEKYDDMANISLGKYEHDCYYNDYGQILADNSYCTNEAEIEEEAKRLFAEDILDDTGLFAEILSAEDIEECLYD